MPGKGERSGDRTGHPPGHEWKTGGPFLRDVRMRMGRLLYAPFTKKMERPVLGSLLREQLLDYLEDDIAGLERHTGLDLSHWRS